MARDVFNENSRMARRAGLLYLAIIVLGLVGEVWLRPMVAEGGSLTALRLSILTDLGMAVADVALAVVFYELLRRVDPGLALMAMVFRLLQAAVIAANTLVLVALAQGMPAGAEAGPFLARHGVGYDVGLIFFAVNSLTMAVLLARAGAPQLLAMGIGAAGAVYLVGGVTRVAAPEVNAVLQPAYLVPVVAELALMMWLLTRPGWGRRGGAGAGG